ncbi:MAG: exodeoxyribonuclease VII large subunit [Anaerolineae bacterium]
MLPLFDFAPRILTVSSITGYLRQKLEVDPTLQDLWLEGEISNWKPATSGHIYFTLKDSAASIRCVVWRSQAARLLYLPQREGEAVLAHGRISVYEAGGNYQFYVDDLESAGQGALYAQFERLKARLSAEGLFDSEHKKLLPYFPRRIGIVTSPTGAALRDMLNVLRRRYPAVEVILSPTAVQGETAARQIMAALTVVSRQPESGCDYFGSWRRRSGGFVGFNDEALARAIAACPIPVVTGIGHEVDFTIADFVADVRAPTPSAAAELVTPDKFDLKRQVSQQQAVLIERIQQQLVAARTQVQAQTWALTRLSPQATINNNRQWLDSLTGRMSRTLTHHLAIQRERVQTLTARLETLNPQATLARGYAIVKNGSTVITHTSQVNPGDSLEVQVSDGEFKATVREV